MSRSPDRTHGAHFDSRAAAAFRTFGFIVLPKFFDPRPLAAEIDKVMGDGAVGARSSNNDIRFRYVPMMTAHTPMSLSLLDRAADVATTLLGGPVLPTRAKGVLYSGNTPWHVDSVSPLASIGFLAYLEPIAAVSGALRVLPGSHRPEFAEAIRALGADGMEAPALPAHVVASEPGDMILLDEHLFHASFGGGARRQWRVDYVSASTNAASELEAYFRLIYPPDWDGGYDVDRYPSYGPDWRNSNRPAAAGLDALGVYELAAKQEAFMRSRRC
jgi:hypothetical protein